MFILVTKDFLTHSESQFANNHVLMDSIRAKKGTKYVPIFKSRDEQESSSVPSYIKV